MKLNSLNPSDIESMNVYKSRASREDYGILAENGVISIITKDYIKPDTPEDNTSEPLILVDGEVCHLCILFAVFISLCLSLYWEYYSFWTVFSENILRKLRKHTAEIVIREI